MTRPLMYTRRSFARSMALTLPVLSLQQLAGTALAQTPPNGPTASVFPGTEWQKFANPEAAGYRSPKLEAVEQMLYRLPTTSMLVVVSGRILYSYGDIGQVSYLASARKSILSMLYGKYVANGTINLDRTIGELGIDEADGLLPAEKTTRVRDLLISSSGVYHPAGSPGGDTSDVPARGSQRPGTYFYYNNWDFNVAGAVFEKLTGKTVFEAFVTELAGPLQLQDFQLSRQRMMGYENQSRYLAYHFFLSARDMARLGLLMARGGQRKGEQIIPASWVKESTRQYVKAADLHGVFKNGPLGYGYLWWTAESRTGPEWAGSFLAAGNFGQYILVLPALDMVIVHRRAVTDEFAIARNLGKTEFEPPGVRLPDFLKVADVVVSGRCGGTC
jgi:CubicO group peptidase (beta-lactamase class C family)